MKKKKVYITGNEASLLIEKLTSQIDKLNEELTIVENKYIEVSKKEKLTKFDLMKLSRLQKQERIIHTKIQKNKIDILHLEDGTYPKKNIFEKLVDKYRQLDYRKQKIVCGIILLLPWIIGFILFFTKPLVTTIYWSFNQVTPIAGGLSINFKGFENYIDLFTKQMLGSRTFQEVLTVSIQSMLLNIPIIFIFSLLVAVVLNTKFKGHEIFKAILFIPVVYNATAISQALSGSFGTYVSSSYDDMSNMLDNFSNYLLNMGVAEGLMSFLIGAVSRIFTIVTKSGIQIIIFIASLQSISPQLYEAAKVEGATAYECFWKITFPMVSPMFLPIIIYSIVDCFATSELISFMTVNSAGSKIPYGIQSSIAVIYFVVNLILIAIIFACLKKVVYNSDKK